MRLQSFITFDAAPEKARELLDPLGLPVKEKSVNQSATVFVDSEEYQSLRESLTRNHIRYVELEKMYFEQKELDAAQYLRMSPAGYWGYPQPEREFDLYRKESFDISTKCEICGNGSIQNRPLLVKGTPRFGRNDILAIHWEYEFLVTARLRKLIEEAGLTGVDFWPILDYRKRTPLEGYHQLHITNVLSPMSSSTQFELATLERLPRSPCSCGKAGRNLSAHQAVYMRNDLVRARDFNKTYEWLGGGYGTTQWKVVSSRVYQLFKEHNINRVAFQPVVVEMEPDG